MTRCNPQFTVRHPRFVWLLAALCVFGFCHAPAEATDIFVAPNGVDASGAGHGTLANPYKTINYAAGVATAGTTVNVRAGIYRETVTVAHSGTDQNHMITFQPYNNEPVTVTGLDPVASPWSLKSGSTNIYQTNVSSGGASQLFVGGQMMTEARWPNAGYNNPLHAATTYTLTGASYQDPPAYSTTTDNNLSHNLAGTNWVGAHQVVTTIASWGATLWSKSREIKGQDGSTLKYTAGAYEVGNVSEQPSAGEPYYINGSLNALDSPNEYYCNGSQLYLQAPKNANLSDSSVTSKLNIEARKRQHGFNLGTQNFVQVRGFSLKAANVNVAGNNNLIDNCQILYPTPYTDQTTIHSVPGVTISGQHNTISHSEIAYSWGDGITVSNSNNTVSNNLIHDVGWTAGEGGFVNATDSGGYSTVSGNTMYNAGRSGVLLHANYSDPVELPNMMVDHNDISRYARLANDTGGIYVFGANCPNSTVAYNRIDGSGILAGYGEGIMLDNATSGVTVHHNLTTNSRCGILLNASQNHNVYNNTMWNNALAGGTYGCGDPSHKYINNLCDYQIVGDDGTDNTANVNHNRYQTVDQFTNAATGDYTLTGNDSWPYDWSMLKKAVAYGAPIPGITPTGNSTPDAGAFQTGVTPWTAGANFRTWLAGNQRAALLTTAVSVTSADSHTKTTAPLTVGCTGDGVKTRAFLKFDMPTGVIGGSVTKAMLRIYESATPDGSGGSVTLQRVDQSWTDTSVPYSPTMQSGTITGFYDPANLDLYTDVDITSWVQAWLSGASANNGLCLWGDDASGTAKYFDGYYGVTGPQLILTTVPEPGALVTLTTALIGAFAHAWRRRNQGTLIVADLR
jgi:hypothetical protein